MKIARRQSFKKNKQTQNQLAVILRKAFTFEAPLFKSSKRFRWFEITLRPENL